MRDGRVFIDIAVAAASILAVALALLYYSSGWPHGGGNICVYYTSGQEELAHVLGAMAEERLRARPSYVKVSDTGVTEALRRLLFLPAVASCNGSSLLVRADEMASMLYNSVTYTGDDNVLCYYRALAIVHLPGPLWSEKLRDIDVPKALVVALKMFGLRHGFCVEDIRLTNSTLTGVPVYPAVEYVLGSDTYTVRVGALDGLKILSRRPLILVDYSSAIAGHIADRRAALWPPKVIDDIPYAGDGKAGAVVYVFSPTCPYSARAFSRATELLKRGYRVYFAPYTLRSEDLELEALLIETWKANGSTAFLNMLEKMYRGNYSVFLGKNPPEWAVDATRRITEWLRSIGIHGTPAFLRVEEGFLVSRGNS